MPVIRTFNFLQMFGTTYILERKKEILHTEEIKEQIECV
jgi:hypothetical protein